MDLINLLKMGGDLIQSNSDDATTGLDVNDISKALGHLLSDSRGGLDLGSIIGSIAGNNGLSDIVSSWLAQGENKAISTNEISELLGSDKISNFASSLGLSEDSAKNALADVLPQLVDKATPEGNSIVEDLFAQVGGSDGAMNMLGKIFG